MDVARLRRCDCAYLWANGARVLQPGAAVERRSRSCVHAVVRQEQVTPMMSLRNRFFVEGVLLGGVFGLLVGSLIAFQIGGDRLSSLRRALARLFGHDAPDRKYMLQ